MEKQVAKLEKILTSAGVDFEKVIEDYTGRKIKELKTHADPQVHSVYALQAKMTDGETLQFLLDLRHGGDPEEYLEDVEFKSWPPKSGELKFF